jgi:hypothetical protein
VQNVIWRYATIKEGFINTESLSDKTRRDYRIMFNFDLFNGFVAVVLSLFQPVLAIILLYTKIPTFIGATIYILNQKRKAVNSNAL